MSDETAGLPEGWNPYEELGLPKEAALDEIKAAFRRLAKKYHPDKAGADGLEGGRDFVRLRLAYEILSDEQRRACLDVSGFLGDVSLGAVAEVDLDDMEWDEVKGVYKYSCRCSGLYEISTEQLDAGFNTVCCSSCSLCVTVLYEIDQQERDLFE